MASQQMLSQTGAAAPAPGGTGPIVAFPGKFLYQYASSSFCCIFWSGFCIW